MRGSAAPLPAAVRAALAGRPLRALWLTRAGDDVDVVAALPGLTELTLDTCSLRRERLSAAAAAGKQLRAVVLRWVQGPEVALVRELFPQAAVTTHGF